MIREIDGVAYTKSAEGKTKIIWNHPNGHQVLIQSKDDITAGDGERRDVMVGKAALATTTTGNCFQLLTKLRIANHFIEQVDPVTFRARRVQMIPIESVVRRIATGSYLKRNPDASEETTFDPLVTELFLKDDARHDPLMRWQKIDANGDGWALYDPRKPVGQDSFLSFVTPHGLMPNHAIFEATGALISGLTATTFQVLEIAWASLKVTLVDLKLEYGFDAETGKIIVADVIDNDSWRIWPGGQKGNQLDKQKYRELLKVTPDDLEAIKSDYALVAQLTKQFLSP